MRDQIAAQLRGWLHQYELEDDPQRDEVEELLSWNAEESPAPTQHNAVVESTLERSSAREHPWSIVRFVLGILQLTGAVMSLYLLIQIGMSTLALSAVVITCLCTSVSVLLFGSRHRGGKEEP